MKRSFPLMLMLIYFLVAAATATSTIANAGTITALIGPPSLGQGGSNPLSIPPTNIIDWQASYRTDEGREWMVSVIPGLYYGQRWTKERFSLGVGGGIVIGTNGVGFGVYQSLGYMTEAFWNKYHFEAEYRQVIGYVDKAAEFPYSFRIGISYDL
ncbi:MAG: hypothetical protein H7318_09515 [Oligoflexus sp.]|nr:hypothetical protein [Oligoflexus sp.]